jgi:ferredoxin
MDLLRLPVAGRLLRWPHLRLTAQLVLLSVAVAVVVHGLAGPQIAPRNLATVLTSIHWRGLLVIGVLAIGNLFCTGCPMILVRDAGRRAIRPTRTWPRLLRGKWLALALLVVVLFVYELFDLWELPRATAWLVLGYFGAALAVDLTFKGASFCKYVCPIGQFNFIASTMAPAELSVRAASTCESCRTSDCIKGRYTTTEPIQLVQRGCELGLFLPAKVGNLECTLCFDCVQACPHDNIALATRVPGVEWLVPGRRSVIGRLSRRADVAALALVFTFAALLSAFAMTAPAVAFERWFGGVSGLRGEGPALTLLFLAALVVLPAVLLAGAAWLSRLIDEEQRPLRGIAMPYVYALVPLGFGVWLAHYGFHLLTGLLTAVPVTQSAAIDLFGRAPFGEPLWRLAGIRSGAVFPIQLGLVLLGAFGSLGLVRAVSRDQRVRSRLVAVPWMALVVLLAAAALWILAQPMEMRGMTGSG